MDENPYQSPIEASPTRGTRFGCLKWLVPVPFGLFGLSWGYPSSQAFVIGTGVGLAVGFVVLYIILRIESDPF